MYTARNILFTGSGTNLEEMTILGQANKIHYPIVFSALICKNPFYLFNVYPKI